MNKEGVVKQIAGIVGVSKMNQVRKALNVPEPVIVKTVQLDWTEKIESAQTVDQCFEIYQEAPIYDGNEQRALNRALVLANTVDQCLKVFCRAPKDNAVDQPALVKALELADTIEQCLKVYNQTPQGNAIENQALAKIENLIRPVLEEATTIKQCLAVYQLVPSYSSFKQVTALKAITFAQTIKELKDIFDVTDANSQEASVCIKAIEAMLVREQTP